MSEDWSKNIEEDDDKGSGFTFNGEHIWIHGVHITTYNCPICLKREDEVDTEGNRYEDVDVDVDVEESFLDEESTCQFCEYFEIVSCPFLDDPDLFDEI